MATRKPNTATPPAWADRFLQWYCHPDLLEEIQGDAYELFQRTAKQNESKARRQFVWNVLRFFRWKNIRKERPTYSSHSTAMLRSYFITGFRNMMRNVEPSAINIIGLSVAIGCAVMIFILEDSYYNLDAMHEKANRIGLVVNHVKEGDSRVHLAKSPQPLGALLKEHASVEKVCSAVRGGGAVRVGDKVFNEGVLFADDTFTDVFSFRITGGNKHCLSDKNEIMISEEMAIKYFGNTNVIGESLSIKFDNDVRKDFRVGAILENTPANSSMYFDFLLSSSVWEELNPLALNDWSKNSLVTFVLLNEGHSFDQLQSALSKYKQFQNSASSLKPVERVEIVPLPDVAIRSYEIVGSLSWSNAPAAMIAFAVIATFLILLACFNYMNVAVASVTTRLKEIGIRKVVGGGKSEIIQQFLVENVLLCAIALILGTAMAYFFLVPAFDALYPIKVEFEISSWKMVIGFFGGLLLFIAIISGAYPALYVSSFNAVKILRGKERFGNKSLFSRMLLTAQFTLSITTIVGCLVFTWSSYYFEEKDWGYNPQQTIVVPVQPAQFEPLRQVVENNDVVSYAGAQHHIGKSSQQSVIKFEEKEYSVAEFPVGFDYLETMNLRLKAGRFFDKRVASDKVESIIINEAFAKKMGWSDAIQKTIEYNGSKRFVVGVVQDFHFNDFFWSIDPAMFTVADEKDFHFLVAKTPEVSLTAVHASIKQEWKKVAPDDPYRGLLQREIFDPFMDSNKANNKVIYFISGVALLLSAMGLYGLVSYNLTRRLKEFSVRKVFGASVFQLFRLMQGDYVWIVLIAFLLGAPLGAFLMDMMLKAAYPQQIPTTYWPYGIAIAVMVLTVALTIASQLKRVVTENPTKTLRID